ncbi:glyoxalase [Natranaerobius trueperi]|uniref:Glyoxalase n=1 Tax=Natranaerobius trueperi TaxID=759412 RepID=A0A226BUY9_9FIRM|nr:glyoxalase [Natranaerobius trueperi]
MSINWTGIVTFFGTDDLEKVHNFYHNTLNLPLYKDQGACKIYQIPGDGLLGFCQHLETNSKYKSPIITLLADDVDQAYNNLVSMGYSPYSKPKLNPDFNIYHFFINDPDGYSLEIQKFLD